MGTVANVPAEGACRECGTPAAEEMNPLCSTCRIERGYYQKPARPSVRTQAPVQTQAFTNTSTSLTEDCVRKAGVRKATGGPCVRKAGPDRLQATDLLAMWEHDELQPVPVDMGKWIGTEQQAARFVAHVFGLQRAAGESWPLVIGCRLVADGTGHSHVSAANALRSFVTEGYLDKRGRPRPAQRYVLGPRASYLVPGPSFQARTVAVEAKDVPAGVSTEPAVEPPHEPRVRDAVRGRATGALHGPVASGDTAKGDRLSVHGVNSTPTVGHQDPAGRLFPAPTRSAVHGE